MNIKVNILETNVKCLVCNSYVLAIFLYCVLLWFFNFYSYVINVPISINGYLSHIFLRKYIKIETLRGKNPTEIHSASSEVCGVFTVGHSTVSRWAIRFRGGCVSIDLRPRRPRTSTDERSAKLVADTLEEDRRATCEEL